MCVYPILDLELWNVPSYLPVMLSIVYQYKGWYAIKPNQPTKKQQNLFIKIYTSCLFMKGSKYSERDRARNEHRTAIFDTISSYPRCGSISSAQLSTSLVVLIRALLNVRPLAPRAMLKAASALTVCLSWGALNCLLVWYS